MAATGALESYRPRLRIAIGKPAQVELPIRARRGRLTGLLFGARQGSCRSVASRGLA